MTALVEEMAGMGGRLRRASAEAAALNETGFFRDRELFDALRTAVLPRLIAARAETRRLRVRCAGCSTGQEAYSVAIMLQESFADQLKDWDLRIAAMDVVEEAVEYARRGRYRRTEVNRGLPARMLVRYFTRDGEEWAIAPELRAICEFEVADVCQPAREAAEFDLTLMRNVLLFLTAQERKAAFANVHRQMARHGMLALGQAEQAEDSTELLEAEYVQGCCFYRRAGRD